jgi:hypothetical protein
MLKGKIDAALMMVAVAILAALVRADENTSQTQPAYTNHLAGSKSPYLQQHAHNPVDWYPWGDEAFDKARQENRPIFLSIGYSTCHWCHVMERESFENTEIAKLINDNFVAIKVDREERPDIDAVYMQFVAAISGSGGWPMTVFLTPDRKPFFGGTYFPPENRDGMIGLKALLPRVHDAWADKHETVLNSANSLSMKLRQAAGMAQPGQVDPALLDHAYEAFGSEFDVHQGGFGPAPKFPRPAVLDFLFHYYNRTGEQQARDMALQTLRAMAAGGIHDQLGGGFHRYSTDDRWFLPHFEKMLYDQAQLACSYLDAWQITHDAIYADTARDILDYVLRDMTGPDGQFYCAEDADSAADADHAQTKGEGAFYVWTAQEIRGALGEQDAAVFAYHFGVTDGGNIEHDARGELKGKNVLSSAHTVAETAAQFNVPEPKIRDTLREAKAKLLETRAHRPRPMRDDKALTGWNGLMISAFARGGAILREPRYTGAAIRAAEFVRSRLYQEKTHRLLRRWRQGDAAVGGFLPDYAFYIRGLLDLYEAGGDVRWLRLALELQAAQDEQFWDRDSGGYFHAAEDPGVIVRLKEDQDNAEPAGNSVAAMNLLRLAQMTDRAELREKANKTFAAFATQMNQGLASWPEMLAAIDFGDQRPRQIVLAGKTDSADLRAMLDEVNGRYLPDRILLFADGGEGQRFLAQRLPTVAAMAAREGKTMAYVCENYACDLPTNDPAKLGRLLDQPRSTATSKP